LESRGVLSGPRALRGNADALGVIPSITDAYLASKVVICSLLEGAGTKLKLLKATYYRVPVVTTSVGASGHLLSDGLKLRTGSVDLDTLAGESPLVAFEFLSLNPAGKRI
jgi:hypothetical protein